MKKFLIAGLILFVGLAAGVGLTLGIKQIRGVSEKNGYYNILDYGAKSDDQTFDNAKIFNKIIQKMGPNGGTIYIPEGNYALHSTINIDRSYVSIVGSNNGLRSAVDPANEKSQFGGGGAKLIPQPKMTAIEIKDADHPERLSGITFKSFQINGKTNDGIGIHGIQDNDRIVIDDLVITNVGTGIQLNGADAPSIRNSWIAETKNSILLSGASQQASIVNNSLGAQPGGTTIELENAQWFNITGNNIYPDGSSNIRLFNPLFGTIASNTISSLYNGIIELLPNQAGEIGQGNLISDNVIMMKNFRLNPDKKDKTWGIVHVEANNTLINGNNLSATDVATDFAGIVIAKGVNNQIANTAIHSPSKQQIVVKEPATNTKISNSIDNDVFKNEGDASNTNQFDH